MLKTYFDLKTTVKRINSKINYVLMNFNSQYTYY